MTSSPSPQQAFEIAPTREYARRFVVARNPDPDSSLPYLLQIPTGHGLTLKAREPWPLSSRVYCHLYDDPLGAVPERPDRVRREPRARGGLDLPLPRHRVAGARLWLSQSFRNDGMSMSSSGISSDERCLSSITGVRRVCERLREDGGSGSKLGAS
jgi:hypothetical protein